MNRSLQVFSASALGAVIGTFVALSVVSYLWWLGLLAGAAVGYLSFEWRTVVSAIPKAWHAAHLACREAVDEHRRRPMVMRFALASCKECLATFTSWGIFLLALLNAFLWAITSRLNLGWGDAFIIVLYAVCIPFIILVTSFFVGWHHKTDQDLQKMIDRTLAFTREAVYWSPPVFLGYQLPRLALKYIPVGVRFVGTFGWRIFIGIHSDVRLLCGIDAMAGVLIGYYVGSSFPVVLAVAVLVGGFAGGLLGAASYHLITIRWLVPAGYVKLGTA